MGAGSLTAMERSQPSAEAAPALPNPGRPVKPRSPRLPAAAHVQDWWIQHGPAAIGLTSALLGILCVLDAFGRRTHADLDWFTPVLPPPVRGTAQAVVTVSGLVLLRVAAGLRRRKRAEWLVALVICAVMTVAHLIRGERRPAEAAIALVLLVSLISLRSRFTAKADPHSRWFAVRVCAQMLAVGLAYGLIALELPDHVAPEVPFVDRLREVVTSLVGLGGWIQIRRDAYADAFHATMLGFGLLTVIAAVVLFLRTSAPVAQLSEDDEAKLRGLLDREGGRDSLGYFALRRDKAVLWSPSGKAAITYRVVSGVALVSGDPLGDPEAWPGAISAYRRLVEEFGWVPAVMGCSERGAAVFHREYGLAALPLGDEAIVDVADFTLDGRTMRGIRQACGRLERDGYQVLVRRINDLTAEELAELGEAADHWRGDSVERGFSMALSRLGDPADGDCVIVTARQYGQLRGLLHFVPWGRTGLSLDLMRRDRYAANGITELMIVELLRGCADTPVTEVSLNFAVFRDPLERGERIGAGPLLRARRWLLLLASRWWQIDSLYRFNAKFQPRWEPRFISFPSVRDLPRIALAALVAEAFIVQPRRLARLLGRA
jgi:lysyl-tRNA synthetase class 2